MDMERKYPYPSGGSLKVPPVGTDEIRSLEEMYPETAQGDWDGDWSKIPDDEE